MGMWGSIEIIDPTHPNSPSSPASANPNPAPIPNRPNSTSDTTTPNPLLPNISPNTNQNQYSDVWKPVVLSLGVIVALVLGGFILYKYGCFKTNNTVDNNNNIT
jgi:hypothetical protein